MRLTIPLILASVGILSTGAVARDRPVVVELFTSQGCSSCPPADALLTELSAGRDILPLAFHVTYWNRLGWRDPFSLEASTERQNAYAGQLGENSVFTPQLVVDGVKSVVGSDQNAVASAIRSAESATRAAASIQLNHVGKELEVRVGHGQGRGRVLLIGFDHRHSTAVGRGENSGRTLIETNIVRSIREIGRWTGDPISFLEIPPAGEDAAILVQADDGPIIGAARLGGAT